MGRIKLPLNCGLFSVFDGAKNTTRVVFFDPSSAASVFAE